MTRHRPLRRTATLVLAVAAWLLVPAVASATFTGRSTTPLSVGTDRMETPMSVAGTYRCRAPAGNNESFEVVVSGFVDSGPSGATYRYTLLRAGAVVKTSTSSSRALTISSGNLTNDGAQTTWTLTIQSTLAAWTGTPYSRTVTCAQQGNLDGSL